MGAVMVATIKPNKRALNKIAEAAAKLNRNWRPEISAAINQTTKELKSAASRDVRQKLVAKKVDVDLQLNRKFAGAPNLRGALYLSEKSLGMGKFRTSQVKAGVRAKIKKQGSMTLFPSAFGPKVEKIQPYVYNRLGVSRYPLKIVPAIVFKDFVRDEGVEQTIRARVKPLLEKNVARRIRLMILRAKGLVPEPRRRGGAR